MFLIISTVSDYYNGGDDCGEIYQAVSHAATINTFYLYNTGAVMDTNSIKTTSSSI